MLCGLRNNKDNNSNNDTKQKQANNKLRFKLPHSSMNININNNTIINKNNKMVLDDGFIYVKVLAFISLNYKVFLSPFKTKRL